MIGGDYLIGFFCVCGIVQCMFKWIGIVYFDCYIDIQEKDLDEWMYIILWFYVMDLVNVLVVNFVQIGIGGW